MKISQIYQLDKVQAQLDFVDITPSSDTPLFIDPFFLGKKQDNWSIEATLTLRSFFQKVIDLIRNDRADDAKDLFAHLHEPNSTCLGMSVGNPRGRGVGDEDTSNIYESLLKSKAIQTGLIQDIEDSVLFVDNFGKDKLSDMATNIIAWHLIVYTQNQCLLHGIPLTQNVASSFFWNRNTTEWEAVYTEMLVVNDKKILLVPKGIVSYSKNYSPDKYYNHFVLNFLQHEHLKLNSALIQHRKDGTPYVTKDSLKELNPQSKDFLRRFTQEHPEVLKQFKDDTESTSLLDIEMQDLDIRAIIPQLIDQLINIPSGPQYATAFHNLIIGILEIIFYPNLINPVKELEIHDGRKRIDICFDNAAKGGIFHRIEHNLRIPCGYIFVECKNYSRDIVNPELDQIAGRFSRRRGKVGFIICRTIDNLQLFINRCRDTYRDDRGLIIPLVDNDIIELLNNHNNWNSNFSERYLSDRVRLITAT
ncbi:hypothetical protein EA772_13640 [Pedobacter sp. G11]|uniref:hypothetical protein n=1 Tax=Pedobacter sp. G11 TaxID=2482728 RepID=UPI000F5DDE29|nr:hypothetical protein [Pedobacter sp. G11]AZI26333.1 hypothetical protein EA772_13640 [Pedobacter sp. G11]